MTFEAMLAELEGLVKKLESGDLALEEALATFERGIGLVRELSKSLDGAESRLEVLLRNDASDLEGGPEDAGDDDD